MANTTPVNIDYSKMIGDREIQLEAMRIVLRQKDERIRQLEERLDALLKKGEEQTEDD